jgi:hypothetical protein
MGLLSLESTRQQTRVWNLALAILSREKTGKSSYDRKSLSLIALGVSIRSGSPMQDQLIGQRRLLSHPVGKSREVEQHISGGVELKAQAPAIQQVFLRSRSHGDVSPMCSLHDNTSDSSAAGHGSVTDRSDARSTFA